MRLVLIRHAIAVDREATELPDDERPLTPRGERRFRRAAAGLARLVSRPAALYTSPLPRARQTALLAARAWKRIEPKDAPALESGDWAELEALLRAHAKDDAVALVGHEPHMSTLLARLLGSAHAGRLEFRKGGVAIVELASGLDGGGKLLGFYAPRALRALAR